MQGRKNEGMRELMNRRRNEGMGMDLRRIRAEWNSSHRMISLIVSEAWTNFRLDLFLDKFVVCLEIYAENSNKNHEA